MGLTMLHSIGIASESVVYTIRLLYTCIMLGIMEVAHTCPVPWCVERVVYLWYIRMLHNFRRCDPRS